MQKDTNTARTRPKRRLHVPVKGHRNIYKSERAGGKWVYECRYTGSDGRRVFEVVGPRLDAAKARLAEVTTKRYQGTVIGSATTTVGDLIAGWREIREAKPRTHETDARNLRIYIEPAGRGFVCVTSRRSRSWPGSAA